MVEGPDPESEVVDCGRNAVAGFVLLYVAVESEEKEKPERVLACTSQGKEASPVCSSRWTPK